MYVNVTRIERDDRLAVRDYSEGREHQEYNRILDVNPIEIAADADLEDAISAPSTVSQVRPWVRYFARLVDIFIFSLLAGFTIGMFAPGMLVIPEFLLTIGILFVWVFQEAILLANCGTTPGKWLFNIRVRSSNGQKLQFSEALNRSFSVWLNGMGAGIPVVSFITQLSSRSKLKRDGITAWDEQGGYVVTHGKIGVLKSMAIAMILFGIFSLNTGMQSAENQQNLGAVGSSSVTENSHAEEDYNRLIELLREASSNTTTQDDRSNIDEAEFKDLVTLSQDWIGADESNATSISLGKLK